MAIEIFIFSHEIRSEGAGRGNDTNRDVICTQVVRLLQENAKFQRRGVLVISNRAAEATRVFRSVRSYKIFMLPLNIHSEK